MTKLLRKILLRVLVVCLFLQITSCVLFAENPNKLTLEEGTFWNSYKKGGEQISLKDVKSILGSDPEASAELDKYNRFVVPAVICKAVAAALVIDRVNKYMLHNSSIDSSNKESFLISFVGVTALAIFFQYQADSHFRKAFDTYNSKLEAINRLSFKGLLVGKNNVGIVFAF